jgi:LysR family transcriptional regulator, glycine cleavage system transcriptional activator
MLTAKDIAAAHMFLSSSTLGSLRFFEAAARLLSFKRAAAELHVTQGAVSQHIKHLEQTLGCKLFFRMPRQIKLTEEGERFAAVVGRALEQIEQEARAIATARSAVAIRLRAGPSFALRWLVPRLGGFYARQPNIKLFIVATYGYVDPTHRDFDIALELTEVPPPTLHSEFFMDEYLVPVCTPQYLAKHDLKNPKDLARCTLLHDGHAPIEGVEDGEWRFWLRAAGAPEVDSTKGQFFSLANLAIEAALSHQGVAMGRSALVRDPLETGQLVAPFEDRVKSPMKYFLVYPKELAHRPGMRSVIRWLREQAGALP